MSKKCSVVIDKLNGLEINVAYNYKQFINCKKKERNEKSEIKKPIYCENEIKVEIEEHEDLDDPIYSNESVYGIKQETDIDIDQDLKPKLFNEEESCSLANEDQVKMEIQEHTDLDDPIYHDEVSHSKVFIFFLSNK